MILDFNKKLFEKRMKEDPPVYGTPTHLNTRGKLVDDYGREVLTLSGWQKEQEEIAALRELLKKPRIFKEDFVGWTGEVWVTAGSPLTDKIIALLCNEGYDPESMRNFLLDKTQTIA